MKKELSIVPAIFPMPVVLIATYNEDGSIDVMNAAWCTAYDFKQIKLNLSEEHMTMKNIRRNKAFTVTMADKSHINEADYFGIVSSNKVKDKFERTHLKAHKSEKINAPILDDFPLCMECVLDEEEPVGYGVIGNIVRLSVEESCLDESGKVNPSKLEALIYDPFRHGYYVVGEKVGNAFSDGRKIK